MQLFTALQHVFSIAAEAGQGASDGGKDLVQMAPGLTWNVSIGQIIQVVGLLVPMFFMWSKSQVRHAMQLRDMAEMRRDLTSVMSRQSDIDHFMRQIPAMVMAAQRGYSPGSVILSHNKDKMGAQSPAEIALREEFDSMEGGANIAERALEAMRKLSGAEK